MKLHRLFQDRRSIAAVEFALVVPVLLILFIGTIEVLTLYRTEAKLNALAFDAAQMVSITQAVKMNTSSAGSSTVATVTSLNDICQIALLGLQPFPASGVTLAIADVTMESGPTGLPNPSPAFTATPSYDEWEGDFKATSGSTCASTTTTTFTATQAENLVTKNNAMVLDPCDNAIIVQATLKYPGITGFLLSQTAPTLTQTAFVRWPYATTTTELICADCTLPSPSTRICAAGNTAIN
jgi:Flp pilus assembly protein TadG